MDRRELRNRMAVLLAGRAAEAIIFDEVSTGGADDFSKATEIACNMVMRYGMDDALGVVSYEPEGSSFLGTAHALDLQPRRYGEHTADQIDEAVRALLEEAFSRARVILELNRPLLERAAADLLSKETLGSDALKEIALAVQVPTAELAGRPILPRASTTSGSVPATQPTR